MDINDLTRELRKMGEKPRTETLAENILGTIPVPSQSNPEHLESQSDTGYAITSSLKTEK